MQQMSYEQFVPDAAGLDEVGRKLAKRLQGGDTCYLQGPLGAGKTTLVRGVLRGLGHCGPVPSPTYTLIESYFFSDVRVVHFDLFRVESLYELEVLGVREYFDDDTICLLEWPDRGDGLLPAPTLMITLQYESDGRRVTIYDAAKDV